MKSDVVSKQTPFKMLFIICPLLKAGLFEMVAILVMSSYLRVFFLKKREIEGCKLLLVCTFLFFLSIYFLFVYICTYLFLE